MRYLIMSSVNICLQLLQVPSLFLESLKDFFYFYLYVSVGLCAGTPRGWTHQILCSWSQAVAGCSSPLLEQYGLLRAGPSL